MITLSQAEIRHDGKNQHESKQNWSSILLLSAAKAGGDRSISTKVITWVNMGCCVIYHHSFVFVNYCYLDLLLLLNLDKKLHIKSISGRNKKTHHYTLDWLPLVVPLQPCLLLFKPIPNRLTWANSSRINSER